LLARYSVWVQQVRKDAALLEVKQSTAPDSGATAAAAAGAMSALGTPVARVTPGAPAVAPAPADHKSLLQPEELLYLYYDVEKLIATVRHCIMRYLV
jgi:sugar (pentulose or hexulose) kinase